MEPQPLLIILGATASGKTRLAVQLAAALDAEIISADSRQVFKDMDIGTGKDLTEYETAKVPFHLINIKDAGEHYHVNAFKEDFYSAFEDITTRGKLPLLCGGTGMYIHSILQGHEFTAVPVNENLRVDLMGCSKEVLQDKVRTYSQELIQHVDFSSTKRLIRAIEIAEYLQHHTLAKVERPLIDYLVIGLADSLIMRREKISSRLNARLDQGLLNEVDSLLRRGISAERLIAYGLEYKYVTAYLMREIDYATLKERLSTAIFQFAKRQQTFFRKMEKDGIKIHWLNAEDPVIKLKEEAIHLISQQFRL